jgi:tripartite-type tricarboxylate transporter receptor subunit TctC
MPRFALALFCALLALLVAQPAWAQQYPDRTIRLICPYAPGGGTDLVARLLGQQLSARLGQTVVIENRPGAGGVVGTQSVVTAKPDGYTILFASTSPMVVMPHMMKQISFDPLKDLAPITLIAQVPALMVVNPSLPVNNVKEFLDLAKARPKQLTFSSSGLGGTAQLAGEMMRLMGGADMLHIPYKGTGPANIAVLAGEVSMTFTDITAGLQFVKEGKMKALAVTTLRRSSVVPDLPAISETLPGFSAYVWYGLLAPAKTPPAIINKLNATLIQILNDPAFKQRMAEMGADTIGNSPAEFSSFMTTESARWKKIVQDTHMTVE